jgi:hypothetical protein
MSKVKRPNRRKEIKGRRQKERKKKTTYQRTKTSAAGLDMLLLLEWLAWQAGLAGRFRNLLSHSWIVHTRFWALRNKGTPPLLVPGPVCPPGLRPLCVFDGPNVPLQRG